MHKIIVYGTLLNGEYNNRRYLQNPDSTLLGSERISGFIMKNMGPFPACVPVKDMNKQIIGEVWEVSFEVLENLDRLEGYPRFYNRTVVPTPTVGGNAWIYYRENCDEYPTIESGDWRAFLNVKREYDKEELK